MKNNIPYTQPQFEETSFNCPICNAYANQFWRDAYYYDAGQRREITELKVCFCFHCSNYSIWKQGLMIFPDTQGVDLPNDDLSEDIKTDYLEAATILGKSPRGAAALLRLSIQKLCIQLGEKGKDINKDIGNLVKKGLPNKVQQSLDSLRVIGNEAVHPGQLDLKDDFETAASLFKLINFIAEKMITEPKEIDDIYEKLPENKREQIEERDKK